MKMITGTHAMHADPFIFRTEAVMSRSVKGTMILNLASLTQMENLIQLVISIPSRASPCRHRRQLIVDLKKDEAFSIIKFTPATESRWRRRHKESGQEACLS